MLKSIRATALLCVICLASLASKTVLAGTYVDGALGDWVSNHGATTFADLLSHHPRFTGELIRVSAMQQGRPLPVSDKLTALITRQITEILLASTTSKIVFEHSKRCQPINVSTVLGIEVQPISTDEFRVMMAMVDTVEGIWIPGTNVSWRGKLTRAQRQAYATSVPGTTNSKVVTAHEVVAALVSQLQCSPGLETPLFITTQGSLASQNLVVGIREALSTKTAMTLSRESAASVLSLQQDQPAKGYQRHSLYLSASEPGGHAQLLAMVQSYAADHDTGTSMARTPLERTPLALISDIRLTEKSDRRSVCEPRDKHCVDIQFDLFSRAYPILFYTKAGSAQLVNCQVPRKTTSGTQHYGLRVPKERQGFTQTSARQTSPAVGFYAVITRDPDLAAQLNRLLAENSSGCTKIERDHQWMDRLNRILTTNDSKIDWRAIHLTDQGVRFDT